MYTCYRLLYSIQRALNKKQTQKKFYVVVSLTFSICLDMGLLFNCVHLGVKH